MKGITKTVWILSLVSLFTDVASEMLYPIMPVYLKSIGFSVVLIGVLEGIAEATAGLSKGYFGKLSDVTGKRMPFVQLGYALSGISRPMMAMFTFPIWIFFSRTLDRLGKGIRTAARDAILSDESTKENKGKVFGFHRAMDTTGAFIGPLLALLYLYFFPEDYITLFYIAFIPGVLAVAASFLLKDKPKEKRIDKPIVKSFSFLNYWKTAPDQYRKLIIGLLVFTLFNSSDVFLLLKAKESGLSDTMVVGVYIFYNLIYALFALPAGIIADKLNLKTVYIFGLFLFTIVYFGMSMSTNIYFTLSMFFVYGVYSASTEGISKAWITNIADKKDTATAIGLYTGFQSVCTMLASSITGIVWYNFGGFEAFLTTALMTLMVALYLIMSVPKPEK